MDEDLSSSLASPGAASVAGPPLAWALCVATLNRIDVLETCVGLALRQTRPPAEVIVVDASTDWEANRDRVAALVSEHPGLRFDYLPAPKRSLTVQRNTAVARARAEILFMIDDDSLMFPDCAEEIMRVYETDGARRIAAVGASSTLDSPLEAEPAEGRRDSFGVRHRTSVIAAARRSRLARFVLKEVLLLSADRMFVTYDGPGRRADAAAFDRLGIPEIVPATFLFGYSITVRREVALREPFDAGLLAYCVAEDMDATYRFGRLGLVVVARKARLHHFQVAAARIEPKAVKTTKMTNLAYFVRKNSAAPRRDALRYAAFYGRVVLAEALKDLAARRWSFTRSRGALEALPTSYRIFRRPRLGLEEWYEGVQQGILSAHPGPRGGSSPAAPPRPDAR